jgi:hypothetical protein
MQRKYVFKYLQIILLIILGSVNFLNAIKTGFILDWVIYALCMIGIMVVAFSIKKLRDEDKAIAEANPVDKKKQKLKK